MRTCGAECTLRISFMASSPLSFGIRTSSSTTSGFNRSQRSMASWPFVASPTTCNSGCDSTMDRITRRTAAWSSAIRMRNMTRSTLADRQTHVDPRAMTVRIQVDRSAEVFHALDHAGYSDTRGGHHTNRLAPKLGRQPAPGVLDHQSHAVRTSGEPDGCRLAPGVPLDSRQCFLHDAKYRRFHLLA